MVRLDGAFSAHFRSLGRQASIKRVRYYNIVMSGRISTLSQSLFWFSLTLFRLEKWKERGLSRPGTERGHTPTIIMNKKKHIFTRPASHAVTLLLRRVINDVVHAFSRKGPDADRVERRQTEPSAMPIYTYIYRYIYRRFVSRLRLMDRFPKQVGARENRTRFFSNNIIIFFSRL